MAEIDEAVKFMIHLYCRGVKLSSSFHYSMHMHIIHNDTLHRIIYIVAKNIANPIC